MPITCPFLTARLHPPSLPSAIGWLAAALVLNARELEHEQVFSECYGMLYFYMASFM
jgi:hypothetical protein